METTPAVVDDAKYSVGRSVVINASREIVWQTITDPARIVRWFGDEIILSPLAVSGTGFLVFDGYGRLPVEITAFDQPDVFAYRWGEEGKVLSPETSTLVTYTLTAIDDGTLLEVLETGFDRLTGTEKHRRDRLEGNRLGWDSELDKLVALLESTS